MANEMAVAGPSRLKIRHEDVDRRKKQRNGRHSEDALAKQSHSMQRATQIPRSLQQSQPLPDAKASKRLNRISNPNLRQKLEKEEVSQRRAAQHAKDVNSLLYASAVGEESGIIETETDLERTARITQSEIRSQVAVDAARKSFTLDLSGGKRSAGRGPYRSDYSRNGRHLLLGGRKGHIAAIDWQTGNLLCEINVNETIRDVTWLHNSGSFAVAQNRDTFIYDNKGIEVHRLRHFDKVERLEFLPYHFLLASIAQSGYLKYQDTSTGNIVAEHRSERNTYSVMTQNPLTAVIHLGHGSGRVTLWTPNLTSPALTLQAHRGAVRSISVSARSGGREMATSGDDGLIKVWDARMLGRGAVREWHSRRPADDIQYSQRGLLGVAWGSHVSIYDTQKQMGNAPPGPYLTNNFPASKGGPVNINFCPFEDVLGVSHEGGFDSLIVPGAGEPRFDSGEADPFETKKSRQEREVRSLLDKLQPDTITLDPEMLGQLNVETDADYDAASVQAAAAGSLPRSSDGRPFARLTRIEQLRLKGQADEGEDAAVRDVRDEADAAEREGSDASSDDGANSRKGTVEQRDWNAPSRVGKGAKKTGKNRMRGRNGAAKRVAVKRSQNVDDLNTAALRTLHQGKTNEVSTDHIQEYTGPASALDYFQMRNSRKRNRAA